jgi:hypothetical protein
MFSISPRSSWSSSFDSVVFASWTLIIPMEVSLLA